MKHTGAIPSQIIQQFIDSGHISSRQPVPPDNLQPSSLDLRLGPLAYKVRATFLPRHNESIEDALRLYQTGRLDISQGAILEKDQTYVVEVMESFNLSKEVHAYTNNKSTSGRTNIWVRALVDGLPRFDRIPEGYRGKVYVMITPRSWSVKVKAGTTLNQARFLIGDNRLNDLELSMAHQRVGLVFNGEGQKIDPQFDRGILLTADLSGEIVGYKAIDTKDHVDLTSSEPHDASKFFVPVRQERGELLLERNEFYIMATCEYLRVPPNYAVEMVAYDIHSGEFRSHYAGFFDPGFGYGGNGEVNGTPAVLEVAPHEDVIIRHGQPICKMVYEYLTKDPELIYGVNMGSHYMHQRGPQLGRLFSKFPALTPG